MKRLVFNIRKTDKTETKTNQSLTDTIIIGRFMRGRFDAPMTIHKGNIRGELGYEPNNPDYRCVQDALDRGVPSLQVLRVPPNIDKADLKSYLLGWLFMEPIKF